MWCGFPFARKSLFSHSNDVFTPSKNIDLHVGHDAPEKGMPELRPIGFAEAVAFLATIPPQFQALKVSFISGKRYPCRTVIYCKKCTRELFRVRFLLPEFSFAISVISSCQCRGKIWLSYYHEGERSHWYYLNCNVKWEDLNNYKPLPKSQPIAKIAKFALKRPEVISVPLKDGLMAMGYSRTWQRTLDKIRKGGGSLSDFANGLNGFCHVRVTTAKSTGYAWSNDSTVISLCWITVWALAAFSLAQFIELDCSWKAIKLYTYCIPLAIIDNEAVPLGFIITPTEAQNTYEWFFADLANYAGQPLPPKPVLSDEGSAVIAFANNRQWPQFFCYFHLIRKFESSPVLQLMATRILRIPTEEHFSSELPSVLHQLYSLVSARHIDTDQAKMFARFLGYPDYPVEPQWPHNFRHGMWQRSEIGSPASNAHNERIHRTAENRTAEVADFVQQLGQLEILVNKKCDEFQDCKHPQRNRIINQLKAQKAESRKNCQSPSCLARSVIWAHRFRVGAFPCKHTVHQFEFRSKSTSRRFQTVLQNRTLLVDVVEDWKFEKRQRAGARIPPFSFIYKFEPVRPCPADDRSFLIRVMRESAKFRRITEKTNLMLDIFREWEDLHQDQRSTLRDDLEVRSEFWLHWMFPS
jgi:hypothetical protein